MEMSEPKITVVIPTRERCDVLEHSLRTACAQDYGRLEILVSDNWSGDQTEEIVRSNRDRRIRYLNTGRRVSMSHNWEFALSHVSDGWVTIIGDDDALLPGALAKVARIVRETGARAVRSSICAYTWPSLTGTKSGRLNVPLQTGLEIRGSRRWIAKVLRGRANYPDLPMLYSGGFVDVEVLNAIKRKTTDLYRSCIPDVYSAVSIASMMDTYVYLREPLAINGASRHSTGTSHFSTAAAPAWSPARQYASEANLPFHPDVPLRGDGDYPVSLQALFYESYLQAEPLLGTSAVDHGEQLRVILATAGKHRGAVEDWGRLFAARHGLDFDAARSSAAKLRTLLGLRAYAHRAISLLNTWGIGSKEFPIGNVYDASVVAGAVRHLDVGWLRNLWRLSKRLRERDRIS
jgi:hypothetical protein